MAPEGARTAQCLQHVRALNRQFKTWVENEWAQNPDALWSGGVADYLRHASGILKEYKEVVERLTASEQQKGATPAPLGAPWGSSFLDGSAKAGLAGTSLSAAPLDKGAPGNPAATNGLSPFSAPAAAAPSGPPVFSWSGSAGPKPSLVVPPPLTASWQPPSSGGAERGTEGAEPGQVAETADEEGDEQQPDSPSVRRAEEEGVSVLKECKAKLWIQGNVDGALKWNARGTGTVVVKLLGSASSGGTSEGQGRRVLIFRNEAGKVLLNASLPKGGMKAVQTKNALTTTLFCAAESQEAGSKASDEPLKPTTVLFRVASAEEAVSLKETIE